MKKLSTFAAAAAIAVSAALPVAAETKSNDPFVSTQGATIPALALIGGVAVIVAIAGSSSGTD